MSYRALFHFLSHGNCIQRIVIFCCTIIFEIILRLFSTEKYDFSWVCCTSINTICSSFRSYWTAYLLHLIHNDSYVAFMAYMLAWTKIIIDYSAFRFRSERSGYLIKFIFHWLLLFMCDFRNFLIRNFILCPTALSSSSVLFVLFIRQRKVQNLMINQRFYNLSLKILNSFNQKAIQSAASIWKEVVCLS